MKNNKDFKVSIFSEPLTWFHDQIELIGNSTLQIVGDIVRGTHTPMDELENPSSPKNIDRNKEGGKPPQESQSLSFEEMEEVRRKKKQELDKLLNIRNSHSKDRSHSR